jgi:type 1 glutamine amidotransferase
MLGGDFLAHPGGEGYPHPYEVDVINRDHPVTQGVNDFSVASEQYYMSTDPNNDVLAETTFDGSHLAWLDGLKSPVAWVRQWGEGRVFYHSIGHAPQDLAGPDVRRLTKQGIAWAARR